MLKIHCLPGDRCSKTYPTPRTLALQYNVGCTVIGEICLRYGVRSSSWMIFLQYAISTAPFIFFFAVCACSRVTVEDVNCFCVFAAASDLSFHRFFLGEARILKSIIIRCISMARVQGH